MDKPKKLILDKDIIPGNPPIIQTGTKYFVDLTENKVFKQDEGGELEVINKP